MAQALLLIRDPGCDAAVLDVNLGTQTAEQIALRLTTIGTPFITVSGYGRNQRPAAFLGAPHLSKPLRPDRLVAELAVSPYVHVLQNVLLSPAVAEATLSSALANWSHGYCPACGSWPALAEIHESHRILRCSFCAHAWELKMFAGSVERPDLRVEICGGCGGYLKTVDVAQLSPFPLLAIADLETMELDMMAMEKGYRRPPLMDFRRPKS